MEPTSKETIIQNFNNHKEFFSTNITKDLRFRILQLKKLKLVVELNKDKIAEALWEDLHKSSEEAYLTETSIVLNEIDYHIKNLEKWAKPKKVSTPIHMQPSSSEIIYEPLGTVLIVSPWNYPFQLLFNPLIGAIAAGCCVVLKPSPDAPKIAKLMEAMIQDNFKSNYISVAKGHREVNAVLFEQDFDLIFFTGSSKVGKIVMEAAAKNLTPVVLELGGKSPCVVDEDADIDIAAKRIVWGKLINAGQTCIAPDYLFAHESIKEELIDKMKFYIKDMYGENIQKSEYYPRIITEDAFDNLIELMDEGVIKTGGKVDKDDLFIEPTIIDEVKPDFKIMQKEIFGPLLPVMAFSSLEEPINYINSNKKPLASYYFGDTKKGREYLNKTTSGGACINDTLMHIINHHLPFGGVGYSGIGSYHGKRSFLAFSNERSVVTTPTMIDVPFKYVPFKNFKWVKKIL